MNTVLKAEQINKIYGKGELQVEALKSTNLELEEGRFYAVIGRSGSGKSTLLHVLGGLDKPTSGKVYLDGEDVSALSDEKIAIIRRRKLGFVFQMYNLLPEYKVRDNIYMPLLLDRRKPDKAHAEKIIRMLGIEKLLKKYPDELSGGEQQRVAIARALISKPVIIMADEPTGNLDKKTSDEVLNLLLETAREFNQTIVMVTHDLDIARHADTIIKINDGEIQKEFLVLSKAE